MERGERPRETSERTAGWWPLVLVLLLALALRLWLAPMRGHVWDIAQFKAWVSAGSGHPPWQIYRVSTANYPPLGVLPALAMGASHRLIWPAAGPDASSLTALLKMPAIAADLAVVWLIYRWVLRRHGRRAALVSAAAYAFNPAIWYVSAWWGQVDGLIALTTVLAVAAASQRRYGRAWAWMATGLLVKPQAAIIAPALFIASWRDGRWRAVGRGALAGGSVVALVAVPLAWLGELSIMMQQVRAMGGRQLFLTMNAHNLWYLVTGGRGSLAAQGGEPILDTARLIGPLTGWQIGLILLAGWCLAVCWALWRADPINTPLPALPVAMAALVGGLFMLPAESHERYLLPALAALALTLAGPGGRGARWLYGLWSVTLWLNLVWVDPAVPLPNLAGRLAWGMPIAAANVGALVLIAGMMMGWGRGSDRRRVEQASGA